MIAQPFTLGPAHLYRQLTWLGVAGLLAALLITMPPIVLPDRTAPLSPPIAASDAPARLSPPPAAPATKLPAGLGPVLNATLAADDTQDYGATAVASSPDAVRADNPAQRFATTFGADGVQIAPASGAAVTLRATAIITAGGSTAIPAAPPISSGPRVEYRRDGLTEWYINGPRGLEQGFTVAAPPVGAGQFILGLSVIGDDAPHMSGDALLIGDLRYGDLTVTDATGATLPAHLDIADGAIQIAVDARGVAWPVTIDPTVTEIALTASDGAVPNYFGNDVASATSLGTTTVVVGAPSKNSSRGGVYVFTGSGTTYAERAKLTASDGVVNDHFGNRVALVSTNGIATIVVGTYKKDGYGGDTGNALGTAYVFEGIGTSYPQKAILRAPNEIGGDDFSFAIAIATDGTNATIVVGSDSYHRVDTFVGSGTSYPQVAEFTDTAYGYNGNAGNSFGYSVAIAMAGGVNTIVVGAPWENIVGYNYPGVVYVYTGTGTSYTGTTLHANAPGDRTFFGASVAVAIAHGMNTIVVGEISRAGQGAAHVFTGNGSTYPPAVELMDSAGNANEQFGASVAVGFAGGSTLVAVSAPGRSPNTAVFLYTGTGGSYTVSVLPQTAPGSAYVQRVALATAVNGDVAVVGGEPLALGWAGQVGLSYFKLTPAVNSVKASIGDGSQVVVSPAGTFAGAPFLLTAKALNSHGGAAVPVDVTFTIAYEGLGHAAFDPARPALATWHVRTLSTDDPRTDGDTPPVPIYPADSAITAFRVTASADGLGPTASATFTLKILAAVPTPTTGGIIGPGSRAGLPGPSYVLISGSGFMDHGITQVWMGFGATIPGNTDFQLPGTFVEHVNGSVIGAYLPQDQLNAHVGLIHIYVKNPAAPGGGVSNGQPFTVSPAAPAPVPAGSTLITASSLNQLLPTGTSATLPSVVYDPQGKPLPAAPMLAASIIAAGGGNVVSNDGSSIVAAGGGNVISSDGSGVIAQAPKLISHDGGSIADPGGSQPAAARPAGAAKPSQGGAPARTALSDLPARNTYYGSSDANGVILSPPITSNGIPGTYTRTIAVDGIADPVTFSITNLDPNDGHPATITGLSSTHAYADAPAFTLTATGTGFINGSLLSFGGVQLVTTFLSATQVSAVVPASVLHYAGVLDVLVINPDPNGGASLPATFTVTVYVAPLPPAQPSGSPKAGTGPSPLPRPEPPGTTGGPPPNPLPTGR